MMKYVTLLRANIKSQRGSFLGILTLVFIITISLCAVLSIWMNANAYEMEQIDRIGYGDITYWMAQVPDMEDLLGQFGAIDEVEKVEVENVVYFSQYEVRGKDKTTSVSGSLHVMEWTGGQHDYSIYNEDLTGMDKTPEALQDGEIYVSPSFASLYDAHIGDAVGIATVDGEEAVYYTIKGYFEDPVAGSALMGMKQALMTKTDMQKLVSWMDGAGERALGQDGSMLHLFRTPGSALTVGEFQGLLNERTDLSGLLGFSYPKATIMGFMLILQNLFSGFLLVFVFVLLIVAMIVIGHSISSSIEQDYVDMGILKAMGYTRMDLRIVQMLQYLMAFLGGMLPGVPLSILLVRGINRLTVTVVGLLIPSAIPIGVSLLSMGILLLVIMGFVCIKTVKIGKITPIRAIRGGAEDVYFKSRLTAPLHQGGLSFWLAYRQLVSGKKQYLSAVLVTALLVFFLSLTVRMDAWLGPDGKGLMDSFAASRYDLGVTYEDERMQEEAEGLIASQAGIAASYRYRMSRASINQIEYLMNIVSAPEYYNILEGRTCVYQNELVMTQTVANELGVRVGDTVWITCEGTDLDFIISGIYQCANDMGANFGVSQEGYERFVQGDGDGISYWIFYLLQDSSRGKEISQMLQETYGEQLSLDENTWSGVDAILMVTAALMVFLSAITIVFILVTVSMTGSKILYKEQHDLGIYKSLGFTSESLRLAFALRFGMAAAAGSAFGIVLSMYLTDPLATAMLKICGISRFTSRLNVFQTLLPAVIVSVLFLVFAYLAAGKVKKVEPGILIVE